MTCVLPPLTYSTVGLSALVIRRPISMWPIQWLTPSNGLFHNWAMVRATMATVSSGGAMPGPFVKHTTSISFGCRPDSAIASSRIVRMTLRWCWAVSRGRNPATQFWVRLWLLAVLLLNYLHRVVLCMFGAHWRWLHHRAQCRHQSYWRFPQIQWTQPFSQYFQIQLLRYRKLTNICLKPKQCARA